MRTIRIITFYGRQDPNVHTWPPNSNHPKGIELWHTITENGDYLGNWDNLERHFKNNRVAKLTLDRADS